MEFFVLIYNSYRRPGQSRNDIKNGIFAYCAMHFSRKKKKKVELFLLGWRPSRPQVLVAFWDSQSREHIDKRAAEQE